MPTAHERSCWDIYRSRIFECRNPPPTSSLLPPALPTTKRSDGSAQKLLENASPELVDDAEADGSVLSSSPPALRRLKNRAHPHLCVGLVPWSSEVGCRENTWLYDLHGVCCGQKASNRTQICFEEPTCAVAVTDMGFVIVFSVATWRKSSVADVRVYRSSSRCRSRASSAPAETELSTHWRFSDGGAQPAFPEEEHHRYSGQSDGPSMAHSDPGQCGAGSAAMGAASASNGRALREERP
eukprot:TRINITY_DN13906_c0_g1_i1.p1 TRINITY_DN13906_c0_g1~~TRINITY_DN13906_c0_g1_i1.p1  ORF type:complete len:240 (+),score=42.17 TRINITY_DN13906_c0_g1_i1:31-750(+)